MKHDCSLENAPKFADWIKNRGGIAHWKSVNLGNPGAGWSSPALDKKGEPYTKPNWQCANTPEKIITDPAEIEVFEGYEHKRFHVGTRGSGNGLSIKVTDAGSRRIRAEVEKAGDGAYYVFDYDDEKNCVIMKSRVYGSLKKWMEENP
jgi:hypothetical protein